MSELTKTQSNTSSNGSGSLLERRNTGKNLTVDTSATDASLGEEDAAATSAAPTGTCLTAETPAPYRDPPPTGSDDERYVPYNPSEKTPINPPTPGPSGMDFSEDEDETEEGSK